MLHLIALKFIRVFKNPFDVLDAVKASDVLLIIWPIGAGIDQAQADLLTMIYSQALPTTIHLTFGIPPGGKHRQTLLRTLSEIMARW